MANILQRIQQLVNISWPGYNSGGGEHPYGSLISDYVNFITDHSLILVFVLFSLIGVGITVIRRLCR